MTDFGQRPRQLLKTGQETSYVDNDDGDLQKGAQRSYTTLTTGQHSGTTDITINGKTHALSNNVVYDNSTGLMWARYVPDDDIGPDNNGKLYWEDSVNSEDIFEFAAQANENSLGGHTDWTIPNRIQLDSLLNHAGSAPFINQTAFPSTPSSTHWTSTTRADTTTKAYRTTFATCDVAHVVKTTANIYCRLVRGAL